MGDVPELTAVEVLDGFGAFFLRVPHQRPAAHDGFKPLARPQRQR